MTTRRNFKPSEPRSESRARQRGETVAQSLVDESAIIITVSLVGHGIEYTRSREEAHVIFIDREGKETGRYQKYVSNLYGYEIRSRTRKTGACRALLYNGQIETRLDERPVVPRAAIFAARAFEWFETNKAAA